MHVPTHIYLMFYFHELLDQLDQASGEEREKMLSLLNAMQEPSNESFINSYMLSTKSADNDNPGHSGQQHGNNSSTRQHVDEEVIQSVDDSMQYSEEPSLALSEQEKTMSQMQRLAAEVFDPTEEDNKSKVSMLAAGTFLTENVK